MQRLRTESFSSVPAFGERLGDHVDRTKLPHSVEVRFDPFFESVSLRDEQISCLRVSDDQQDESFFDLLEKLISAFSWLGANPGCLYKANSEATISYFER